MRILLRLIHFVESDGRDGTAGTPTDTRSFPEHRPAIGNGMGDAFVPDQDAFR
jgi:hypothetical protein